MTTIHRTVGAPADPRVVFSKYNPGHQVALDKAIKNNLPTNLNEIPEAIEAIRNEMKAQQIILMNDSRFYLFDAIWDTLPKETNHESDQPTGDQPQDQV